MIKKGTIIDVHTQSQGTFRACVLETPGYDAIDVLLVDLGSGIIREVKKHLLSEKDIIVEDVFKGVGGNTNG